METILDRKAVPVPNETIRLRPR